MDYFDLKLQLQKIGVQLASPPSSTKKLLDLLDKTKDLLTIVGQTPSIRTGRALLPSMSALISNNLMKQSDVNVKVSVASCLCEVGRISVPYQPYDNEIMKEIFQLIVWAFGELSIVRGRNYDKAVHIIESFATVKLCLIMLNLGFHDLILKMFQQFLSIIREDHPSSVFSYMENIMTLVIEESDGIDRPLLTLLFANLRKEKQNVSPAPWKLAEKVLKNCYNTLKPYSSTLKTLIEAYDDYADIVTNLCQNDHANDIATATEGNNDYKRYNFETSKKIESEIKVEDVESSGICSPKGRPENEEVNSSQESKRTLVQDSNVDARKSIYRRKNLDPDQGLGEGVELVGQRIKVRVNYGGIYQEGTVLSYIHKKHKVRFDNGDQQVLDLHTSDWRKLSSKNEGQDSESPSVVTLSTKSLQQTHKRKLEGSSMQNDNLQSPNKKIKPEIDYAQSAHQSLTNIKKFLPTTTTSSTSKTQIPNLLSKYVEVSNLTSQQLKERIQEAVVLYDTSTKNNPGFFFTVPNRSTKLHDFKDSRNQLLRQGKLVTSANDLKFAQISKILEIIAELCKAEGEFIEKREVFYYNQDLFKRQSHSNNAIQEVSCMLGCSTSSLPIVASEKGSVIGNISFTLNGKRVDCRNLAATSGQKIPAQIGTITNMSNEGAEFILLVEKESTFTRLARDRFFEKHGCIILTGKGQPDVATRLLLRKMKDELKLPVLALIDGDPHGFLIFTVYRFGSHQMSYDSEHLTTPDIIWLGVKPSDFEKLDKDFEMQSVKVEMKDRDLKLAENLMKKIYVQENPLWVEELKKMVTLKHKVEIQTLNQYDINYLLKTYLPTRLREHGF